MSNDPHCSMEYKVCPEGVSASVGAWLANNPLLTCQGENSEVDEIKSTCSSHPFGSPHPSDPEEHIDGDGKRHWKRKGGPRTPYPKSERQQLALLKQITSDGPEASPKSPSHAPSHATTPVSTSKQSKSKLGKIHKRNVSGETPLHISARKGEYKKCRKLLIAGADVNAVDNAGWTSLHEACNYGFYRAARILIKYGANVNALGLEANTPLHDAVNNEHVKLVSLLIFHGANRSLVNEHGKRAVDLADNVHIRNILHSDTYPPISPSLPDSSNDDTDSDDPNSPRRECEIGEKEMTTTPITSKDREKPMPPAVPMEESEAYNTEREENVVSMRIPAPIPPAVHVPPSSPPPASASLAPPSPLTTPVPAPGMKRFSPKSPQGSTSAGILRSLRRRDMLKKRRHHHFAETQLIKRKKLNQNSPERKHYKKVGRPPKHKLIGKSSSKDIYEFHSSDSDEHNTASKIKATPEQRMQELQICEDVKKPLQVIVDEKTLSIKKRLLLRATLESSTLDPGSKSAPPSVLTHTTPVEDVCVSQERRASSEHGQQSTNTIKTVPPLKLVLSRSISGEDRMELNLTRLKTPSYFVQGRRGGCRGRRGFRGKGRGGKESSASRLTRSQVKTKGLPLISPKRSTLVTGEAAELVDALHPHKRKMIKGQSTLMPSVSMVGESSDIMEGGDWSVNASHTAMLTNTSSVQAFNMMRQHVESKWDTLMNVQDTQEYTPPEDFHKYKLSKKDYLLQRNIPTFEVSIPTSIPTEMIPVYEKQEEARHGLQLQHRVERERLILCCEKEVLRCHVRHLKPRLTVVRVLNDAEIYNPLHVDKETIPNRCNQSVMDKDQVIQRFNKLKGHLIWRHKAEAQAMAASQQLAWEGEMKRTGLVLPHQLVKHNVKHTPIINIIHDFDLLP